MLFYASYNKSILWTLRPHSRNCMWIWECTGRWKYLTGTVLMLYFFDCRSPSASMLYWNSKGDNDPPCPQYAVLQTLKEYNIEETVAGWGLKEHWKHVIVFDGTHVLVHCRFPMTVWQSWIRIFVQWTLQGQAHKKFLFISPLVSSSFYQVGKC